MAHRIERSEAANGWNARGGTGALPAVLLAIMMIGCTPRGASQLSVETLPWASAGEAVRVPLPAAWTFSRRDFGIGSMRFEYVPSGQTTGPWTEMISVSIIDRGAASSVSALVKGMDRQFRSGADCAVPPTVSPPIFLRDGNGHTDGTQTVACGKGKGSGQGEYAMIRTIEGKDAYYQLQRSWRLPAAASTSALEFSPGLHQADFGLLLIAVLCDNRVPASRCQAGGGASP
jgi:hypothetical protein